MNLDTFFEKFDLFADAPNAVAKMRELILDLAIKGQLVAQDPDEDGVSLLLDAIQERRHAIRVKNYGDVNSSEQPFQIPSNWLWVRLGNIALASDSGWSPQCESEPREGTNWGVLKVSAVSWGVFRPDENKALPPGMDGKSDCEVHPGDFLLSRANTADLVARSVIVRETPPRLMMSDKIVRFSLPDLACKEFINIANLCQSSREYYAKNASGTSSSMKNVGREVMCNLPIPLPPLAEQKRIVAKVDELMALCDRLEAQQQQRETSHTALAQASLTRFADAPTPANLELLFHKSYAIEPGELRKRILDLAAQERLIPTIADSGLVSLDSVLAEASVNGVSKGPSLNSSATEILKISAGTSRKDFLVDEDDYKHVELDPSDISKFSLAPGDLLACRFNGNLHYVGRFSYYRGISGRTQVNPDKLIRFRVDTNRCDAHYVCYVLNAPAIRLSIESMCATTAGNIGLSAGKLKTVEFPLPPLAEQKRIVAKVEQLMGLVDRLEAQLGESRAKATALLDAVVAELSAAA